MPYISNETLIGAALLIVLAFGYQYIPSNPSATARAHEANQSTSSKKRNKKKQSKSQIGPTNGSKESDEIVLGEKPGKQDSNDNYITDKGIKEANNEEADKIALGESKDEGKTQQQQQPKQKKRLLAEKLLPKQPKTKVDDMLAPEDRPGQIARVMRVTSSNNASSTNKSNSFNVISEPASEQIDESESEDETPESGSGNADERINTFENDYSNLTDFEKVKPIQNDGWDVVTSKKKKTSSHLNISSDPFSSQSTSTSLPLPPGAASRQQKKNAKKAEEKKLAREAEEIERQRRLALHRKDLERERINELYAAKQSNSNRGKVLSKNGTLNNSSKATLNENGKLVWD
ncbi:uncharacterized protein I206_102719 [Kwoniella pini CBS 10737]|uniref:Uncharacterized protein n=1 Tax=Kwoniella pini CBS 10737 TaxID=1296096 RepID=A0A1B9I657_9TREE|nr:uncharacterized protein I206_03073 [Kwoniella pini CBS 10737]OCF51009.1 hypothetical protein I206_03073 [Kwoniella pini CBS 10737]